MGVKALLFWHTPRSLTQLPEYMKYAIIVYESNNDFQRRDHSDDTVKEAYWGAFSAYHGTLIEAGVLVGGEGLQGPDTATILHAKDGERSVQDGPYADSKEQLGGFFIVDVPDLDTALDWAAKAPTASTGKVEVRPLLEHCDDCSA